MAAICLSIVFILAVVFIFGAFIDDADQKKIKELEERNEKLNRENRRFRTRDAQISETNVALQESVNMLSQDLRAANKSLDEAKENLEREKKRRASVLSASNSKQMKIAHMQETINTLREQKEEMLSKIRYVIDNVSDSCEM